MKKVIRLFLFFIISVFVYTSEANIGVFNTLRLGKSKKNFEIMASGIKKFEIIGLVEVMDEKGLEKLVDNLEKVSNKKWAYHISPYAVGTDGYKEYYGYVYQKDKVKFLGSEGFYPDPGNKLIREPYAANFKIDNFDFTFVLIHSIFGKKESQRRAEAFQFDDIYKYFQEKDPKENDIIIAGDFNLPANDESFQQLMDIPNNIIYAIDPTIKTTIGSKGFANSYDNFFISLKYTKEFTGVSGAIDITNGNYIDTRKNVSDHLPIFMKVLTGEDDD